MASVVIAGDVSGTCTLQAANAAGTTTLTLPTTSGTLVATGGAPSFTTITTGLGNASAPSITFTGDTNTGIFSPTADTIAFTEGGTESMRIDASGNLGIGTTSPTGKLNVVQNGTPVVAQFDRTDSGTGLVVAADSTGPYFRPTTNTAIRWNNSANNAEYMRITSTGNVQLSTAGTSILNSSGNPILRQTGSVLQVVSTFTQTQSSFTGNDTWQSYTSLNTSITPTSSNSKILVIVSFGAFGCGSGTTTCSLQLLRSGTPIGVGSTTGSQKAATFKTIQWSSDGNHGQGGVGFTFLDSPSTTSSTTYSFNINPQNSFTWWINRNANGGTGGESYSSTTGSSMTLMEIAG